MSNTGLINAQVFPRANLTTASGTKPVQMAGATAVSFHMSWEGTPRFTVRLQTSNDPVAGQQSGYGDATWFTEPTTVSGSGEGIANSSSVVHLSNVNSTYCRLLLTPTVSGTVKVLATTKL